MATTTTFLQLRTEFYARGYDYLNDGGVGVTRAKAWINQAYMELCDEDTWPFLLATASGAAPLTIAEARMIVSVQDTANASNPLEPIPEDELIDAVSLLTTTGTPQWFYLDDTIVRTYPVGGTLSVRYYKVPTALSADGDVAVVPDRFANLIVDGAVRRAAIDSDNAPTAQLVESERQKGIEQMRESLLFRSGQRIYQQLTYSASVDW